MTTQDPILDTIEVLLRRSAVVERLSVQPTAKGDLVDGLDVSRSTVDRAVRETESTGLVECSDNGVSLTLCGRLLLDEFERFNARLGDRCGDDSSRAVTTELIATATQRSDLLGRLLDSPLDKRGLADELDVSRSTIDRAIRELETAGLIAYADGRFGLTPLGQTTTVGLFEFVDDIHLQQRLEPFLQWIPDGSIDFDLRLLADAKLLLPEPGDPWAMVNHHVDTIRETADNRSLLPVTGLHGFEVLHRKITAGDAKAAFVVEPKIAETFRSNPSYTPLYRELCDTDQFEVRIYDDEIPYYLGVLDETVQIGVDEDGEPRAMVETENEAVVDWAVGVYEDYKRSSEPTRLGY